MATTTNAQPVGPQPADGTETMRATTAMLMGAPVASPRTKTTKDYTYFTEQSVPSTAKVDMVEKNNLLTAYRKVEARLALVCYGGVSLAVYMHGNVSEVH